jgi:hypothetical protein
MKSVGNNGSESLPVLMNFMMKLTVWYFISDT